MHKKWTDRVELSKKTSHCKSRVFLRKRRLKRWFERDTKFFYQIKAGINQQKNKSKLKRIALSTAFAETYTTVSFFVFICYLIVIIYSQFQLQKQTYGINLVISIYGSTVNEPINVTPHPALSRKHFPQFKLHAPILQPN